VMRSVSQYCMIFNTTRREDERLLYLDIIGHLRDTPCTRETKLNYNELSTVFITFCLNGIIFEHDHL
jgi:hypothetical protein